MKHNISIMFIILIAALSVGGLISTDIFLPALNNMRIYYQVSESQIQNSIAIFLLGISFSQLVYGPLSDSFGRKKILIIGMLIWFLSTLGVLYSSSINELLFLRLMQGVGSCAGITISRAIISDIMDRDEAGQLYFIIFPFVGMSPAIAPFIGGILNKHFGWQSCFVFLIIFIILTIILCFLTLKETLPREKRKKLSFIVFFKQTAQVLCNKKFIHYALIPCFAYGAYFSYIVESPFLLTSLGLPSEYVGYTYILVSATYVAGNLTAKKISKKIGIDRSILKGYVIFIIGSILFVLQMFVSPYELVTTIITISILTFGNGFLLPLGTASAISSHPLAFGTASGVMGALQLGSAALASFLIGKVSSHDPQTVAIAIATICVIGFFIHVFSNILK